MFHKIFPYCLGLIICFGSMGYAEGYTPKIGESLEYKVVVKSAIHGANQTIKVVSKDTYNGRDVYKINSEMMTVGLVKGLYKYYQVEDMVLDAEGLYPWVIKREIRNGGDIQQEETNFDYSNKKARRLLIKNVGAQEWSEINLPGFIQDELSLLYFLRKNQVINSVNKVYFYANGSVKENTYIVKQAGQAIHLECGTYSKYLQIIDKVSKITVLVTDAPERFPIIIKSIASFGAIEMKLLKIEEATQ